MKLLEPIEGLPSMFARCFLSTLESTLQMDADGSAYVITGDIDAMWLRDSTQQVLHYLRFAREEEALSALIRSLIERQARYVLLDPYANAFNRCANGRHGYADLPAAGPAVWERKYELDSLCHVVLLAWRYHEATGSRAFMTPTFEQALERIVQVLRTEQRHESQSDYTFQRFNCPPSDTLPRQGRGEPVAETGMTWSGFRPSDDACQYGYLVPANLFAAAMLAHLAMMAEWSGRTALASEARALRQEIRDGVERFALVDDPEFGQVYAYEVDGLGGRLLMDDANVPSLLSLPYIGACAVDDALYRRTRAFVLSPRNPHYYEGRAGRGVGSPHTPQGYIWPIALCVQGMTATDEREMTEVLGRLITTHAGTARMHEGFDKDNAANFTRPWFAWANSMFGEFIYRLYEQGRIARIIQRLGEKGIKSINELNVLTRDII